MPDDPILHDLRQVSDEMLLDRLFQLRQRFPTDATREDYIFRCDTWEMANKAVRAEIRRRQVTLPIRWVEPPRRRPFALVIGCVIVGAATVMLFGTAALTIVLMLSVLVGGMAWLVPEVKKNQRL